jgi:protein-disulfide isomerase/uncharacterized membrane protein
MRASPTRHRVALTIALIGVAVSALTLVVHQRLETGSGYTSFCNLGGVVNCDLVIGSRYGRVAGVSIAAWSLAAFVAGALLALPAALTGVSGGLVDLALLALVSASAGVALVWLGIALLVLRHLCLLCLTADVVIAAWLVTVLPLASRFETGARARWWRRPAGARAIVALALALSLAGGTLAAVRGPGGATTAAEVRAQDPKFYQAYLQLPVRPVRDVAGPESHVKGRPGAEITIVEFSDFQCPACAQAFQDLRDLVRARADVRVVFRYFPLDASCNTHMPRTLHPDACAAAVAAECAGQQGRFWEYHDALFENQHSLDRESLLRFARELQLDLPTFRTCLDDPAMRARVGQDVEDGIHAGVSRTPTLFINGRLVDGALEEPYYTYALIIEKHERDVNASRGGS